VVHLLILWTLIWDTEQVGSINRTSDLYLGGAVFDCQPGHQLFWHLSWFLLVLPAKGWDNIMTTSFHILFNSVFICHPTIWACVVGGADSIKWTIYKNKLGWQVFHLNVDLTTSYPYWAFSWFFLILYRHHYLIISVFFVTSVHEISLSNDPTVTLYLMVVVIKPCKDPMECK
jgi:hypothetical protein